MVEEDIDQGQAVVFMERDFLGIRVFSWSFCRVIVFPQTPGTAFVTSIDTILMSIAEGWPQNTTSVGWICCIVTLECYHR